MQTEAASTEETSDQSDGSRSSREVPMGLGWLAEGVGVVVGVMFVPDVGKNSSGDLAVFPAHWQCRELGPRWQPPVSGAGHRGFPQPRILRGTPCCRGMPSRPGVLIGEGSWPPKACDEDSRTRMKEKYPDANKDCHPRALFLSQDPQTFQAFLYTLYRRT